MKKLDKINKNKILRLFLIALLCFYLIFAVTPVGIDFFAYLNDSLKLSDNRRFSDKFDLSIEFFNVGTSDAILIKNSGKYIMVDTSENSSFPVIDRQLKSENIKKLDALFISHFDSDHAGNALNILRNYSVEIVYMPLYYDPESYFYIEILDFIKNNNIPYEFLKSGDSLSIASIDFEVLGPVKKQNGSNNNSLVFTLKYGDFKTLFTGDMESDELEDILKSEKDISCNVLKVSHHGSINGISIDFLNKCSPDYAVICVGRNTFGLPNAQTTELLNDYGAQILRTDKNGDIVICVNSNDKNIYINTEK